MAGCCGGKNAGKPISPFRYAAGMAFFVTYHTAVAAALAGAEKVSSRFAPVKRFHRTYFRHLLQETMKRQGITVGDAAPQCAVEQKDEPHGHHDR
jgi:hypothetical protein